MDDSKLNKIRGLLEFLFHNKPRLRENTLKLKGIQINLLSEIILNILLGNLQISKPLLTKLSKYKLLFKTLALKKAGVAQRRKLFASQRGGSLLSILIPAVLGLLF